MFILWIHILFASSWILKMCFVYLPSLNNSILCVLGTLSLIVMEVLLKKIKIEVSFFLFP
jgi:hypothetical protein